MALCIRQIWRPTSRIQEEGWGDCTICSPNEDNRNCKGFVTFNEREVVYDYSLLPEEKQQDKRPQGS